MTWSMRTTTLINANISSINNVIFNKGSKTRVKTGQLNNPDKFGERREYTY